MHKANGSVRKSKSTRQTERAKREEQALAFQRRYFDESGRLPTFDAVGNVVDREGSTLFTWKRFMEDRRLLGAAHNAPNNRGRRHTGKEEDAITFQDDFVAKSGRLPTCKAVAKHVGVHVGSIRRWKRFRASRAAHEAAGAANNRGRRSTGKEAEALSFQKSVFDESGRLPTYKAVAEHLDIALGTVFTWRGFRTARRALEAKGAPGNRRRRPPQREDKAIDFQQKVYDRALSEAADRE